jgi:uncharacterized protein YeaC (DUF1315 family)
MDFDGLIKAINPEVYDNLKRSLELGKWPDGRALTSEQKELCMQAIIVYETGHQSPEERTGYIHKPGPTDCEKGSEEEQPLKWEQDLGR